MKVTFYSIQFCISIIAVGVREEIGEHFEIYICTFASGCCHYIFNLYFMAGTMYISLFALIISTETNKYGYPLI